MARIAWTMILSVFLVFGCGGKKEDSSGPAKAVTPTPTPEATTTKTPTTKTPTKTPTAKKTPPTLSAATAIAEMIFKTRCVLCHGVDGTGTGPAAATLNPKPRNYTDPAWQDSVDDKKLAEIIVKGGKEVGLSDAMPPNPDLVDKPEVVAALIKKIRSFRRK